MLVVSFSIHSLNTGGGSGFVSSCSGGMGLFFVLGPSIWGCIGVGVLVVHLRSSKRRSVILLFFLFVRLLFCCLLVLVLVGGIFVFGPL